MKSPKTRGHLSSKGSQLLTSKEQNRMENELDELIEAGLRRWVITNFSELKEHVLIQSKETEKPWKKVRWRAN